MKHLIIALATVATIAACDVIDNPIQTPDVPIDSLDTVLQNVLLEDYTGHTCGNCPEAADLAHQIQDTYGSDRVIVVAVHSGHFARPAPPDYPMDWRTTEGEELDATFRISRAGNPNGLVNRITYNGKFIQSKDNWAPATTQELDKQPILGIKTTPRWDETSRTSTITVELNYLEAGTSDYYLVGWLIENGLKGDQIDYRYTPSHIKDFKFEHVLRASYNGTWGEQVSAADVPKGTKLTRTLTLTIPSGKDWNPDNCEAVIYVHRHQTEKNVVQVVKTKVK